MESVCYTVHMSTVRKTIKTGKSKALRRFAQLASMGEVIFHTNDLAVLWQIKDRNTLYTTLKRYVQQGLLYRIWRGMYSLKPVEQLDHFFIGVKAVHGYAYVSMETVLFQSGIINQYPHAIALISNVSRRFIIGEQAYVCRKLADQYLYQTIGVSERNGVRFADPERAVADMLYFNPRAYFDAPIDWKKVKQIQRAVGYPLTMRK